jgi:hypothetical protein
MIGAFVMLWISPARRGQVMAACVLVMAGSVAAMAVVRNVAVIVLVFGALSLGFSMLLGLAATTVQQLVPGELRGRVMSVSGLTFSGTLPFAALALSFAVARLGFTPVFLASALVYAVAGLALLATSGILGWVPPAQTPDHAPRAPRVAVAEASGAGDG